MSNDPLIQVLSNLGLDAQPAKVADEVAKAGTMDGVGMFGWGWVELRDASTDELKERSYFGNLISTTGDEYYARRGANVSVGTVPTGMRIGYGTTAVAKSGAGSAIVSYETGKVAYKVWDGSFPTLGAIGSDVGWRITWKVTWGTGEGNLTSAISETVVTNETGPTDVAGTAANTISRALVSPTVAKTSSDTLAITWQHDFYDAP